MKDLKRCPFCGAKDEHDNLQIADHDGTGPDGCICVECQKCGTKGPWAQTAKAAMIRWNLRH